MSCDISMKSVIKQTVDAI